MGRGELKNKMRTLGQGKLTDGVLDKMAMTFTAFAKQSDFEAAKAATASGGDAIEESRPISLTPEEVNGLSGDDGGAVASPGSSGGGLVVDGLVYNIQIQLPESRDPKVYDALFESLAKHLRA
jgi:hypothetical protein